MVNYDKFFFLEHNNVTDTKSTQNNSKSTKEYEGEMKGKNDSFKSTNSNFETLTDIRTMTDLCILNDIDWISLNHKQHLSKEQAWKLQRNAMQIWKLIRIN